ncbi:uncharacterized protein LOC106709173 [Papilio machaon]|uniref:uncharacterized protein LOC106709173 n=1 Tax=Papilio machaon TaxID=76193 RepID=UPI001E666198|nr:uncharacterized protein LOC106709173 [Papilio machaon]
MATKPVLGPEESVQFLFEISKVVKLFYETPVIFFTNKDYSEYVFNTMCELRLCLQTDNKSNLMDIILDFHLQWLHAVNDIENFMKIMKDLTKDEISQAISFTIDAMALRLKYYEQYMNVQRQPLKNEIQANIISDIEIVEEMHEHVIHIILEKLKCFRSTEMQYEFNLKLNHSIEEFLHWLDKIYDSLAMLLCNYINFNVPHLSGDLTKTLQQIVGDMKSSKSISAQKILEQIEKQDKDLSSMIRSTTCHSLEICKVLDKINIIEDRIARLENEPLSAAVMALKHKKGYLEKRLNSLENMKITLKDIEDATEDQLKSKLSDDKLCVCEDFYQLRIFNHQLPTEERERLVTELCYLWDLAIFGDRSHKSIISILSVADMKEEFTDELGTFIIDEHSRKIYKLPDDETKYQPNENNDLVPLTDDNEHVYYYDECGRYFIDPNTRQRVYKALDTSSEYMMSSAGVLLKTKEVREGITYYYDNYGRYYINNDGKNIYKDVDAQSEYENDGFGNLVRIRSQTCIYNVCPDDENVTEDFTYIKQNVGKALRQCIAQVILQQPADPVEFLSESLIKYRENIELKDKRAREKEEMGIEKENIMMEERAKQEAAARAAAQFATGGSEASYDSNLQNYTPLQPEDLVSIDTNTK